MSSRRAVKENPLIVILRSARGLLREIITYNMGRVGLVILAFMIVMSIYSLTTLPGDFPSKWRYATEPPWIYNPKMAKPEWVRYLGIDVSKTSIYSNLRPQDSRIILIPEDIGRIAPEYVKAMGIKKLLPFGYVEVYRVNYNLDVNDYAQDVLVIFEVKASENVNLSRIKMNVLMLLTRPDGLVLEVGEESFPLDKIRLVKIDHGAFSLQYIDYFNLTITLEEMKSAYYIAVFGEPRAGGREFARLPGEYQVTLILAYTGIDPREIAKMFGEGSLRVNVEIRVLGNSYGLLGTDNVGRDLFQGVLFGFPVALAIGFLVALATVMIGLVLGVISGYFGGRVDEVIQRLVDVIVNVPLLPLLILVGVAIQTRGWAGWPAMAILMFIIVVFSWGGVAIVTRSMALSIKSEQYVEAAKAIGASTSRIVFRHIIPQLIPYTMAVLVFSVPGAIIAEAGLSVLGIDHGLPTWGRILADAQANRGIAYNMWWWILPPGLLLGFFSFAFVALGFTLETIVEPRLRRR
ncbi:MAG: ABC transporter permease [Thermoprotei archaeon]|nr:ABC transporter permease [Thermoprotei archaeon]